MSDFKAKMHHIRFLSARSPWRQN